MTTAVIALAKAEAHLWRVHTHAADDVLERAFAVLSLDERARAARLRHASTYAEFVMVRFALRSVLSRYTGAPPETHTFAYNAAGKPSLQRPHADLRFSVSHARGLGLIAVAHRDVGVDVEAARPHHHALRVAHRLLGPQAAALLESLPVTERERAFLHAWTQREAYVKATGGTLFRTQDPLTFRWPRPLTVELQSANGQGWTVIPCAAGDGRVATMVAEGEVAGLRVFDFAEKEEV
jgi:4'-phosphopantetheinyl transferase